MNKNNDQAIHEQGDFPVAWLDVHLGKRSIHEQNKRCLIYDVILLVQAHTARPSFLLPLVDSRQKKLGIAPVQYMINLQSHICHLRVEKHNRKNFSVHGFLHQGAQPIMIAAQL